MKKHYYYFIDMIAVVLLVFIDQLTKQAAVSHLKDRRPVILIDKVLQLRYLENRGAAFGIFQNQKILFLISALIMLTVILYVLLRLPSDKKFIIWHVFICFITAGGIGNMIDRISHEYVVDFIYFILIDFPIFNFADILVTIGTILLFIDILFLKKEEDLLFLKLEKRRNV